MWFYPSIEHFLVQSLVALIFLGITISIATAVARDCLNGAVVTRPPLLPVLQLGGFALQYVSVLWLLFYYYPAFSALILVVLALTSPLVVPRFRLEEAAPRHSVAFANFTIVGWFLLALSD
jgi:hypothetical protein